MNKNELFNGNMKPSTPKLNPLKYSNVKCDKCGSELFEYGMILKRIPGLELGAGVDDVNYPIDIIVCKKCGAILKDIREELKLEEFAEEPKEETKSTLIL